MYSYCVQLKGLHVKHVRNYKLRISKATIDTKVKGDMHFKAEPLPFGSNQA